MRARSRLRVGLAGVGVLAAATLAPASPASAVGVCTAVDIVNETSPAAGDPTCVYDQGAEVFNVMAYGAKGYLDHDATPAIEAADAAATAAGGIVFFPPGEYRFIRPLTASASWYGASVGDTVLHAKLKPADPPFPLGATAVTFDNPDRVLTAFNLRIAGPGGGDVRVVRGANLHGVAFNSPASVRRVGVDHFDQGYTVNSGHVTIEMGQAGYNYAGLYVNTDEPGIFVTGTVLTGNFASLVSPAHVTMNDVRMDRVHLGMGPYGVYQEAGSGPGWMDGLSLEQCAFEAIGNAAMFTENIADPVTSLVQNFYFASGGGSFFGKDSTYGVPSRSDDYTVDIGSTAGSFHVTSALADFPRHAKGSYSIKDNKGSLEVFRATLLRGFIYDIQIDVADGADRVQLAMQNIRAHRLSGTIPAGSSSTVVSTEYLGPAESILPFVQPTGTATVGEQLALVVSGVESAASRTEPNGAYTLGYTRFTVTAVGDVPTADVPFTWQIGDDLT